MQDSNQYIRCSVLAKEMDEYIEFRRNGGVKFVSAESTLNTFDRFLIKNNYNSKILNRDIVMSYLSLNENERIASLSNKTSTIRGFLKFLSEIKRYDDTFTNIPPLNTRGADEYVPYIFSEEEVSKIINEAHNYITHSSFVYPNMGNIISCVFVMLYCTGMRVGEASNLKVEDVDVEKGLIYIREAKNNNKRLVTMSNSLKKEVERYIEESRKCDLSNVYFFDSGLSMNEGKICRKIIYKYFRKILRNVGIKHKGKGYGPRVHDLRHTFVCHSLKQLSKLDGDINAYLVYLSTFVGHKSLLETQKYIWLTEDLFKETREKLELYTSFINDLYKGGTFK